MKTSGQLLALAGTPTGKEAPVPIQDGSQLGRTLGEPQSQSGDFGEEKNLFSLPGI
jgi:hypothetical protein